jgi:hypothetical protein
MAHFAEVSPDGTVLRVLVVPQAQAHRGADFLVQDVGLTGIWVPADTPDGDEGARIAGPGMHYDPALQRFLPPRPFPSWVAGADGSWQAPQPRPEGAGWAWHEPDGWVADPDAPPAAD